MRKLIGIPAVLIVLLVASSIYIHPYGHVKAAKAAKPLFQGAEVDLPVFDTLRSSCRNCHSDETAWPWYSYVAPVEWLVEKDVRDARAHFNMSHWNEYTAERQEQILDRICYTIRNQPLHSYLFARLGSRLNAEDIDLIDQWGQDERNRVKSQENQKQEQTLPVEVSQ